MMVATVAGTTLVGKPMVHGRASMGVKTVRPPRVLVTRRLLPTDYPQIRESVGVVCEQGGKADHACVIARILGRPVILVPDALQVFQHEEVITMDSRNGLIWRGATQEDHEASSSKEVAELRACMRSAGLSVQLSVVGAEEVAAANHTCSPSIAVKEFFVRSELMWATLGVSDPYQFAANHGVGRTTDRIVSYLMDVVAALCDGQCVNFRSLDLRSDEFQTVDSVVEPNPVLGYHGIRRTLQEPAMLQAEIEAVGQVESRCPGRIVYSLPFVVECEEVDAVIEKCRRATCERVTLGVFIETAAAVAALPELLNRGVARVYIGTKDLTQMIMACDRSNARMASYYSPRKPAVVKTIREVLLECNKRGVPATLFTDPSDLGFFLEACSEVRAVSMCAGDLIGPCR